MKRKFNIIKAFIVIAIIFMITSPITTPFINNRIADSVRIKLEHTPLPEDTEICDRISLAGKLCGNGNGMQYFGAILIKSDLKKWEVENHYDKYRKKEWQYVVEAPKDNTIEAIEHKSIAGKNVGFDYLNNKDDLSGYYIVYTWGDSNYVFKDLDIRAH